MSKLFCTNLDEAQRDVDRLNDLNMSELPPLGTRFRFPVGERGYELEVHSVAFDVAKAQWIIELHLPSYWHESIARWIEHMKELRKP